MGAVFGGTGGGDWGAARPGPFASNPTPQYGQKRAPAREGAPHCGQVSAATSYGFHTAALRSPSAGNGAQQTARAKRALVMTVEPCTQTETEPAPLV